MRPFRFQLESVRALSEHAEAAARLELASELAAGLARAQELDEADVACSRTRARIVPLADGSVVSAWDLLATDAYLQRREASRTAALEALLCRSVESRRSVRCSSRRRAGARRSSS